MNAANADVRTKSSVTAVTSTGLCALPSAHFDRIRLNARLSRNPPASPPITLNAVLDNTRRSTCHWDAPSAMRIPNSLVLRAIGLAVGHRFGARHRRSFRAGRSHPPYCAGHRPEPAAVRRGVAGGQGFAVPGGAWRTGSG